MIWFLHSLPVFYHFVLPHYCNLICAASSLASLERDPISSCSSLFFIVTITLLPLQSSEGLKICPHGVFFVCSPDGPGGELGVHKMFGTHLRGVMLGTVEPLARGPSALPQGSSRLVNSPVDVVSRARRTDRI